MIYFFFFNQIKFFVFFMCETRVKVFRETFIFPSAEFFFLCETTVGPDTDVQVRHVWKPVDTFLNALNLLT